MTQKRALKKLAKARLKAIKPRAKVITSKERVVSVVATKRLLSRPEGLDVDFKRNADAVSQDDLVAFANAGGGTILVGVDETRGSRRSQKGKVVGCDVSDRERNKIVSRASGCRPAIPIRISVEKDDDKAIMRVNIPAGGLHCTSNGTYKIRRDGQIDIIDPSAIAQIVVMLEREKILSYLREAVRPEIESSQDDMEGLVEEMRSDMDDLRAELEDVHDEEDVDHQFFDNDHDER